MGAALVQGMSGLVHGAYTPIISGRMQVPKPTEFSLNLAADLNKWRVFVAIGELGSLTRAAIFLDSNQSLLSRQVNALERECGARLFNRTGRGVELSDIGQRLFPQVKELLANAQMLEAEIRSNVHEPMGRVTLGLLPSIGCTMISPLFEEVRSRYPGVNLKVLEGSSGQVEEWLADARVDIAIFYRYGANLPEQERALATVDSYLIGRKGELLTTCNEVPFKALDGLPFILPSVPNGLRTTLDTTARQLHIALGTMIEADSLPLQKQLIAEHGLFTVLPIHAVWAEVQAGTLQAARINDPPIQRTVSMAFAKTKGPSRAITVVSQHIVRIVEAMAQNGMWYSGKGELA